jgi:methylamine dehydrogenase accessory protein MauD
MEGFWLLSYLGLWIVVGFLIFSNIILARQVGLIHRRLGPSHARMENAGPEINEVVSDLKAIDLRGREIRLGGIKEKHSLVIFMAPTCPSCAELAPALRSIAKSEADSLELILVSLMGDETTNQSFIAKYKLENIAYIISDEIGFMFKVASSPYGLLIDKGGVLRAKGVVNHLEQLESLLNTIDLGHPSMESYYQIGRDREATPNSSAAALPEKAVNL